MLRIAVFISGDLKAACPVVRLLSPLKYLSQSQRAQVIVCNVNTDISAQKIYEFKKAVRKSDIVIFQRYIPYAVVKAVGVELLRSKKIVYETDDNLLNIPDDNPASIGYKKIKDEIRQLIDLADLVTVSTDFLKKELSAFHDDVRVLGNYLDSQIWTLPSKPKTNENETKIGYSGSFTHQADLELLRPIYEKLNKTYGNKLKYGFIGCKLDGLLGHIENDMLYRSYEEYARNLSSQNFDIVMAPLLDNDFNRGKSNLKFLEYSACGFPGVYSFVGPYENTVDDGCDGYLIKDNDCDLWYERIVELIENKEQRQLMMCSSHKKITDKFLLNNNYLKWHDCYEKLLNV